MKESKRPTGDDGKASSGNPFRLLRQLVDDAALTLGEAESTFATTLPSADSRELAEILAQIRRESGGDSREWKVAVALRTLLSLVARNGASPTFCFGHRPWRYELRRLLNLVHEFELSWGLGEADRGARASAQTSDLITLNQASALVKKTKRTLHRWQTQDPIPAPVVEGGGGRTAYYPYAVIRPWLEKHSGLKLPDRPPASER